VRGDLQWMFHSTSQGILQFSVLCQCPLMALRGNLWGTVLTCIFHEYGV